MFFSVSTFFSVFSLFFLWSEIVLSTPFWKVTKAVIKRHFTKLCSLLPTFVNTQETFQRCLNVVVRLIWRRDVGQFQINVETTLCMSTLKFKTLSNVKSTLSISTLILTMSKQCCYFQRRVSQRWSTSKQRDCEYDHIQKVEKIKKIF